MTHSDQVDQLAAALSKAQGEIQNVVKDAKNPHYRNEYATLDAVTDTVRPIFAKHGLSVVQIPTFADGVVTVATMLLHSSGQWLKGMPAAPLEKPNAQGVGSATTYLRRYSLAGIAAIAQTDDDGNGTNGDAHEEPESRPVPQPQPQQRATPPPQPPQQRSQSNGHGSDLVISEAQAKRLYAIAKNSGWEDQVLKDWLYSEYGYSSSKLIKRSDYDAICNALEGRG